MTLIGLICRGETIPYKTSTGIVIKNHFYLDNIYHIYLNKAMPVTG